MWMHQDFSSSVLDLGDVTADDVLKNQLDKFCHILNESVYNFCHVSVSVFCKQNKEINMYVKQKPPKPRQL